MILQLGALFGGIGNFLKTGIEAILPGGLPQLGTAVLDVGRQLITNDLQKITRKRTARAQKAALRDQSNIAGQTPAIPSTTAVATGGRVHRAALLTTNLIPPGPQPIVFRPAGLRAGPTARIASQVLKGINRGAFRGAARFLPGAGFATTLAPIGAARSDQFAEMFPGGPSRLFLRNGGGMPNGVNGFQAQLPGLNGTRGQRIWQRTADGCNVQHFTCDPDTGQMAPIEQVANPKGLNRFRLDLATQKFIKLNPRRMNPLNFRAAARARSRTSSLLRIVRTMFTEHRRETKGAIRIKKRRSSKKK